ncbi:hypothetical protein HD554DRAFT_2279156 [Boletus coccyginus]|nr:hypothetical protein HD554DRAFT_2279156 [Boletus coccyginus]
MAVSGRNSRVPFSFPLVVAPPPPLPIPRTITPSSAHTTQVRNHTLDLLFDNPIASGDRHKLAMGVDWTLSVFYATPLEVVINSSALQAGRGYHFGSSGPGGIGRCLALVVPSEPYCKRAAWNPGGQQGGTDEFYVLIENIQMTSVGNKYSPRHIAPLWNEGNDRTGSFSTGILGKEVWDPGPGLGQDTLSWKHPRELSKLDHAAPQKKEQAIANKAVKYRWSG